MCVVSHSQVAYHILEEEPLILPDFLWMSREVWGSVDDRLCEI